MEDTLSVETRKAGDRWLWHGHPARPSGRTTSPKVMGHYKPKIASCGFFLFLLFFFFLN